MGKTMNREDLIQASKDLPIFSGIKAEEIQSAFGCVGAFNKKYHRGEYIILLEESVKSVGVVLSGKVQMIQEDLWGNKAVLLTMGEKELFGESFACGSKLVSSVSFVAIEETNALFLPFERVMHTCMHGCQHHHRLIVNMVALIAEKNALFIQKIEIMSKKSLREKIFAYLLFQASNNDSKYFTIPLGRVQLSEYLNVDRSALTRELNNMRDEGFIDFDKNTFRILRELEF